MGTTVTLQVEGLHCSGCEQRLGTALRRLEGVFEAAVDHRTGEVRVRFDPRVTGPDDLMERIHTAGYTVVVRGEESSR